ncbi:hypothetical protein ACN28G_18080 [Micromonospora sp. WMMA1923]|uniref:hypothetical protein n=1 Tax=Micromonospora sp. WMMA1923 TaxID=3404125 RepID=UPI003B94BBDF
MSSSRGGKARSPMTIMLLIGSVLALIWAVTMLTSAGQQVYAFSFFFTEFFAGVVALVALSLTVMMGLIATDRLVLKIPHRVLLQSAHRATGIIGVVGLVFHVITKIAIGRAGSTDAIVPFVGGRGLYVGLGTISALLMVSVLWTGLIRARFAGVGPKWLWRGLHSMAYVSWPFAIGHGLNTGRPPATWVTLSYLACVLLVVVALFVRLSVTLGKRSREQTQAAALNLAMAGKPVDQGLGKMLLANLTGRKGEAGEKKGEGKSGRGRSAGWADTTTTSGWSTSAGAARRRDTERFTVPVVPEPGTLREPVRPPRRRDEELAPAARRRDEELAPVARRRDEDDLVSVGRDEDERPARRRRDDDTELLRAEPERGSRRRRVDEEELAPVARRRDDEGRSRRDEDERRSRRDEEDRRSRRDADEYAPVARREERTSRRRRDDDEVEVTTRRSRPRVEARARYSAPPLSSEAPEEPWDSPRRWEAGDPVSAAPRSAAPRDPVSAAPREPISAAPRSGSGRHSIEDEEPEEVPDYWRPPGRYVTDELPVDDTPTLVDLASRRARKASDKGPARRGKRANADAVDSAYWAGLRGEAK